MNYQHIPQGSENFSVGVGLSIANPSHHPSRYMADQTFHTPNFGDDEFDIIPPISLPHGNDASHAHSHGQSNMSYSMGMGHGNDQQGQQQHYSPMYLPEHMTTPMTNHSPVTYGGSPPTYTNLSSPHSVGQAHGNPHMMHHQQPHPQQHQQVGNRPLGPPRRSPTNSTTSPANPETNTSEDSDDSVPVSQMTPGLKRPSPEPVAPVVAPAKKPKPQKKKKKRDPNEPQKPVSAYALFFRDTQAAIKGQNPSASFGEVSKIVASMWDALDADSKNVYKKKTEAAKKEYLKALAAYRASLVSKGAPTDSPDGSGMYPPGFNASMQSQQQQQAQAPPPQQQQQQHYTQQSYYQGGTQTAAQQKKTQQAQQQAQAAQQSPQQQPPMHSPQQQAAQQQNHPMMQQIGTHNHMLDNQYGAMRQQHPNTGYMTQMGDGSHGMGMGMHIQQQAGGHAQQQVMSHLSNESHSHPHGRGGTMCIRSGCNNGALTSQEWDEEYCSTDCVVTHCRDVFTNWVSTNQGGASTYHAGTANKFSGPGTGGLIGPDGVSYVT